MRDNGVLQKRIKNYEKDRKFRKQNCESGELWERIENCWRQWEFWERTENCGGQEEFWE